MFQNVETIPKDTSKEVSFPHAFLCSSLPLEVNQLNFNFFSGLSFVSFCKDKEKYVFFPHLSHIRVAYCVYHTL